MKKRFCNGRKVHFCELRTIEKALLFLEKRRALQPLACRSAFAEPYSGPEQPRRKRETRSKTQGVIHMEQLGHGADFIRRADDQRLTVAGKAAQCQRPHVLLDDILFPIAELTQSGRIPQRCRRMGESMKSDMRSADAPVI